MAVTPYHVWQPAPLVLPAFFSGPWGTRWAQSTGLLKDAMADAAEIAVSCHRISDCPDDTLKFHGDGYDWPQAPGEDLLLHRSRLKLAWPLSVRRGTKPGMVAAFNAIGLSNVDVKETFDWGRVSYGRRDFWIIVRQPHPFGTDFSFAWGDGTSWGSKPWGVLGDPTLFELMRRMVRQMRPAHAQCREIIVVLAGDVTDGTNTPADGDPTAGSKVIYLSP